MFLAALTSNLNFNISILAHLLLAVACGGLVGIERSTNGRAAGFRTYALVCLSSTLLIVVNAHPALWYGARGALDPNTVFDPTRVVQGLMTGIGFLGAGVIVKDGFNVRGLTTAASIWAVAAVGVLVGLSFYLAAIGSTLLIVGLLSVFRKIETFLPQAKYGFFKIRLHADALMGEHGLRSLLKAHNYDVVSCNYQMSGKDRSMEFHMITLTKCPCQLSQLTVDLAANHEIVDFNLAPSRD